jgi:hypothetical protein
MRIEPIKNPFLANKAGVQLFQKLTKFVTSPGPLLRRILQNITQKRMLIPNIFALIFVTVLRTPVTLIAFVIMLILVLTSPIAFLIDITIGIVLLFINAPIWMLKKLNSSEEEKAERKKAREIARKSVEEQILQKQEVKKAQKVAQLEQERLKREALQVQERTEWSDFQISLYKKTTSELLEMYDEVISQINLQVSPFSEKSKRSKKVLNELNTLLERRGVTEEEKRASILDAYNERLEIENLGRLLEQEEVQQQELELLRAELQRLQQVQTKRKIRLGVGIGFWF